MRKQMLEVSVELQNDGMITITQPNGMDEPAVVMVAPEQVSILVDWLNEATSKAVASGFVSAAADRAKSP